jgi:hypothetical protein
VAGIEPYGMMILLVLVFMDPFHLIYRVLSPLSAALIRLIL